MEHHSELCGFYKIEVFKKDSAGNEYDRRVAADWFPNIITNIGLDRWAGTDQYSSYTYVGSSGTSPAASDTNMGTLVANTSVATEFTYGVNGSTPYYRWVKRRRRFNQGQAAGNLAEVGMGWNANPSLALFSRALILDSFGAPTTITVLSDEYLDVTYEFRVYLKETDVTGATLFTGNKGASFDWTLRPASVLTWVAGGSAGSQYYGLTFQYGSHAILVYRGAIRTILNFPETEISPYIPTVNIAWQAYSNGTYYRDVILTIPLVYGNHADGIMSVAFGVSHWWMQIGFDPVILKTEDDIVTLTFRFTWSRRP